MSYSQQTILPQPITYLYIELGIITLIVYPKTLIFPSRYPYFSRARCFSFLFTCMLLFLPFILHVSFACLHVVLPTFLHALTYSLTLQTTPFSSFACTLQNLVIPNFCLKVG
jgi:hypothetical protein